MNDIEFGQILFLHFLNDYMVFSLFSEYLVILYSSFPTFVLETVFLVLYLIVTVTLLANFGGFLFLFLVFAHSACYFKSLLRMREKRKRETSQIRAMGGA